MKKFLLWGLIIAIITPIAIAYFMHKDIFSRALGDANGWLGYWGGYLGALIGAATVYIATRQQLETQKKLHMESLEKQTELHRDNLIQQKELQLESIRIGAEQNDERQRDLLIVDLRIKKIDSVVQDLINLNILNWERFNLLSEYNGYNDRKKNLNIRIRKEKGIITLEKLSKKKVKRPLRLLKIRKNNLYKLRQKRINLEKALAKRNEYINLINDLLDRETRKRNEIRSLSAKVKSDAMFADLDDDLDAFRGYQDYILEFFYQKVLEDTLPKESFDNLIKSRSEELQKLNNKAIWLCKSKLNAQLLLLQKGSKSNS
ncbi:hypothetical protein [Priestia megaterium]|uniref:hypothetical protein n=1 Tax=Priestia megaterium TaxID=1404 RepID=UPI00177B9B37|nr:hypothetical protein [Priestia megaterium]MBD8847319.1 hypothetical protein [Priestia megaterium]